MKGIYILSNGHSGSTLLDLLLSSHSKIVGLGEIKHIGKKNLDTTRCTCTKTMIECPFWQKALKGMDLQSDFYVHNSKWASLFNLKRYYHTVNSHNIPINPKEYLHKTEQLYQNIGKSNNVEFIVDSCKNVDRAEILLNSKMIQPIIIHLVRNGHAVVWSFKKRNKKTLQTSLDWLTHNLKIEVFKKRHSINAILVRYEDLVNDPAKTLTRILKEIGLNYEPEMIRFQQFEHHQIGGNSMRFKKNMEIREDIEWKEKMPLLDKWICNLLLSWLNYWYNRRVSRLE